MNRIEQNVAEKLLEIKAVFLRPAMPFTWASGIKSPIYCDNRLTLAYPKIRKMIEEAIAETVKANFKDCEVLMGTATAGIPHAAIAGEILELPMGYVRADAKSHGRNNQIEGADVNGKKVVVIEDLISTAGSSVEVVEVLRQNGANVLGIVSIFTYDLQKGKERLEQANVKNISLSNIHALCQVAFEKGYITKTELAMVKKFIAEPSNPDWQLI